MEADAPLRVLVVEDSKFLQMWYRTVLSRAGYEVIAAASGRDAMPKALACRPDVIILDMMLPCTSGLDVLRMLKHSEELCSVPVVVISAVPPLNQQKLLGEGAARFLYKEEVTEATMLSAVREALAIQRKQADAARLLFSQR